MESKAMRDVARFEDFFLATPSDPGCNTLKRGGVAGFGQKVLPCHILLSISFLLGYPLPIGLTRADPGKSGRTIATPPPKTGGSCGPGRGEVLHASIWPHGGRYRPHGSLREG